MHSAPGKGACCLLERLEQRTLLSASVVGEMLYYRSSPLYDLSGNDDAAIAVDKQPLLAGQTAAFANESSYSRGINGVMIDIAGARGPLSASDFLFKAGNSLTPSTWAAAPSPLAVLNRPGAGTGGSERVEIAWPDGAIANEWLQVTVLADTDTGLVANTVFYFGNLIGATGASPAGQVTPADEASIRVDPHSLLNPAAITDPNDLNRDGRVDAADQILARTNSTNTSGGLVTLSAPAMPQMVAISTVQLTAYTELSITGTSAGDVISVSESGNTFTILSNGGTQTISGSFGALDIHAGPVGSTISVDPSVTIDTFVYGGAGNDTLTNKASGPYDTIVSIGGGTDTLTGNGSSTYSWADASDRVNASPADTSAGRVRVVPAFYQPWSTDPSNANYVPLQLAGQNLKDPTDAGSTYQPAGASLWGAGPALNDVRQGQISDCYLVAALDSLAFSEPARLYQMAVDLGDGTYAVRFVRAGAVSYVRVDRDLATFQAAITSSGGLWVALIEKAYAYYRSGANTFASLNTGWMTAALQDFGCTTSNISIPAASKETTQTDAALEAQIVADLAAGQGLTIGTPTTIAGAAPLIAAHAYTIIGAYYDSVAGFWELQLRNPWGFDGAGNDGNPADGIVTITFAQLTANCSQIVDGY